MSFEGIFDILSDVTNKNAFFLVESSYKKGKNEQEQAMPKRATFVLAILSLILFVSPSFGANDRPRNIILFGWDGAQRDHVKECLKEGLAKEHIVEKLSTVKKLKRQPNTTGLKTAYTQQENVPLYSAKYIENLLTSRFGKPAPASLWSAKDAMRVVRCCDEGVYKIRQGADDTEAL